ncbi:PAS domain S-box protein [Clostridium tetanomorphum]|uniref:histidine kinase n=2 Tax=Clostridium tetanomorphum TaxID=1553 RepID=A0A923E6Z3_CLOTT|nr:PAS domain S-box protein [Clostridium tetanomorphum]MBC2397682.1 PAS domain S-box protein [Clostridium tetanomorphum]
MNKIIEEEFIKQTFNIEKMKLDNVCTQLLKLSIINSEAEKGYIIKVGNNNIALGAVDEVCKDSCYIDDIEKNYDVPKSIIHYVSSTLDTVVIGDSKKDYRFKEDEYIKKNSIKSVLCMPILFRGILKAILYLENNIKEDAFNLDKIKMMQLLWAYGVVSVENSIIYNKIKEVNGELEKKVEENMKSLRETVIQLKKEIMQKKQAEEALKESEEKLRTLINAMPDCICFKDGGGKWIEANNAQLQLLDLKGKDYIGKSNKELGEISDFYKTTLMNCEKNDIEVWKNKKINRQEDYIPRKDGNIKIFDTIRVPLFCENGNRKGLVVIGRDITKHKQSEIALYESEKKHRRLMKYLPDAVYLICEDEIIFCNTAGIKLLGLKNINDVKGKNIKKYLISSYYEKTKEKLSEKLIMPLMEQKLKRADGRIIYVEIMSTTYTYEGKKVILSVLRDITERKRNEELNKRIKEKSKQLREVEEYDKVKTEFFANVSHELKTPINVIFSALQMCSILVRDIKDEKIIKLNRYMNMMMQNCYRLIRLSNNIIDITKIDTGYVKLNLENADIVSIIENITMSVVKYAKIKGIQITFDTDVEEKVIACDVEKLQRILLNLLSNAIKFTDYGGDIFVNIRDKTNYIEISVKDNGVGIPKEKQESIFHRFIQVDKSLSRNNEGSGIGLSLAKALIEMHNGTIYVNSELGCGSEFIVNLPVRYINNTRKSRYISGQTNIEKMKIEFSDIYL